MRRIVDRIVMTVLATALTGILAHAAAEPAATPVLHVKNVKNAAAFWRTVLGVELELGAPAPAGAAGTFVRAQSKDRAVNLLFIERDAGAVPAPALPHVVLRVADGTPIERAFPDAPAFTAGDLRYVLVKDPDGNLVYIASQPQKGITLFNGKDLDGWYKFRNAQWTVEDGVLVGEQGPNHAGGWLITEESFGDFTLTLEFRISRGANSGVCVRYPGEGAPPTTGLEIQLCETDPDYQTGSLFGVLAAPRGVVRDGWNTAAITVLGKEVTCVLNGQEVARAVVDRLPARGQIGLQMHGNAQYAGTSAEFKNMRLMAK